MIIEYFLFQKVFLFRGNSSFQFLAKTIVLQFSRMNLPLGKKNRMHPPIHPPPPSFFPQSEFQLPFLRFFRKNRQTNGQCYLPTQENTERLPKTDQNTTSPQCRLSWKPLLEKLQLIYLLTNDHAVSNVDTYIKRSVHSQMNFNYVFEFPLQIVQKLKTLNIIFP